MSHTYSGVWNIKYGRNTNITKDQDEKKEINYMGLSEQIGRASCRERV